MSRTAFFPSFLAFGLLAAAVPASAFTPTRISVAVRGSGPDVILIPGLASSRGIWNGTVAALPGYRYHLVQVAGFAGTAPGGNGRGRVAAPVADEIARYIRANRLRQPALVGHSMGGSIAMMVGVRHPGAAGRVMVVDMLPSPAATLGVGTGAAAPIARFVNRELRGAWRLRRDLAGLVGRFGNADWMSSRSDGGVVGRSVEELIATDLRPELRRIRAPLTVVYACPQTLDAACGALGRTYARAYAARPGTELIRVERSGHSIMLDRPVAFRRVLRDFLRRP